MPVPAPAQALLMKKMSQEILKASPKASIFTWHVIDEGEPSVYLSSVLDAKGNQIGGESFDSPENRIVAKYQDKLGWSKREDGLAFAYSVEAAQEITDADGTGSLDPEFEGRPGLEMFY